MSRVEQTASFKLGHIKLKIVHQHKLFTFELLSDEAVEEVLDETSGSNNYGQCNLNDSSPILTYTWQTTKLLSLC